MGLFTKKIELSGGGGASYYLIPSAKWMEIESASREWGVKFSNVTMEYGLINELLKTGDLNQITELARAYYMSRLLTHVEPILNKKGKQVTGDTGKPLAEMRLLREFYSSVERMMARKESERFKGSSKDDLILAEEAVLHEKTVESIQELEKIKKDGKA